MAAGWLAGDVAQAQTVQQMLTEGGVEGDQELDIMRAGSWSSRVGQVQQHFFLDCSCGPAHKQFYKCFKWLLAIRLQQMQASTLA